MSAVAHTSSFTIYMAVKCLPLFLPWLRVCYLPDLIPCPAVNQITYEGLQPTRSEPLLSRTSSKQLGPESVSAPSHPGFHGRLDPATTCTFSSCFECPAQHNRVSPWHRNSGNAYTRILFTSTVPQKEQNEYMYSVTHQPSVDTPTRLVKNK